MPDPEIVTLTWFEILHAAHVGCAREVTDRRDGLVHGHGFEGDGFAIHIVGCHGEMATAKYLDRFWSGALGNFAAADVGLRVQVRASAHPRANLLVHLPPTATKRGDKPEDFFVCARVLLPDIHLMGWRPGVYAQQQKFWRELQPGRPAFVVPVDDLMPMFSLRAIMNTERAA